MSPIWKTRGAPESFNLKKLVLPVYIVVSAVFMLAVIYSYANGVIYKSGLTTGQQQGYEAAVVELAQQISAKCEAVAITVGEQQINVINTACLQSAETAEVMENESK